MTHSPNPPSPDPRRHARRAAKLIWSIAIMLMGFLAGTVERAL